MDIFEKAKELGQMILDSEQFAAVKSAEEAQLSDETAQALTRAFNEKREELVNNMRKESLSKEEINEIKRSLQIEFDKLSKNEIIANYITARQNYETMVGQVNNIISFYVTGKNPADDEGCGGDCSGGCGGCGHNH